MKKQAPFFDFVSDHFEVVYWVPGNHEYYHFDLANKCGKMNEKIRSNVFLVNNRVVQHPRVRFIFSTLWSSISPANQLTVQLGMSDFRLISYRGNGLTTSGFNMLHSQSKEFISQALQSDVTGKTVVITHHVPTLLNYPEKYRGDPLNEAFAVELNDMIQPSGVEYWIYGHHHQNIPDFTIGTTKLITNQLGYVRYDEHLAFRADKTLVI